MTSNLTGWQGDAENALKNSRQIQTKIKAKTNFQCDYNRKGLKNHKKLKNKRFSGS